MTRQKPQSLYHLTLPMQTIQDKHNAPFRSSNMKILGGLEEGVLFSLRVCEPQSCCTHLIPGRERSGSENDKVRTFESSLDGVFNPGTTKI